MGPVLNGLIKLQSVENRLRVVKSKLARCRRNVIIQENHLRSLTNSLEAKREEINLTKVQADRLELELRCGDATIAKLRASLNAAKSNKEYASVLTQLNTTKADNSKVEDQILELMKDIDADESESREIKEQIAEQKQKLERTRQESETLAARYEAEIEQVQQEWDQAAKAVPAEALRIFGRVAETYDGEALAVVDGQEGKTDAYTCGGCFMGITAETVNLLLTKDDIFRCPNCTRILVISGSEQK
jgi:predicted  nucleic acid-binding Zn-ribbon protein